MLFDTITGSLLRSIQHDSWDDGDIYSQSMVFDQSNYIAASLTINNDWYMFRLLLANVPSDVTTDWVISTSGVNDKYNKAKGYSIIFDRITSPTGYFTSGQLSIEDADDKGFIIYHILNNGDIKWEGLPDGNSDYEIKYLSLSPDNLILWGCGIGSDGSNDRA